LLCQQLRWLLRLLLRLHLLQTWQLLLQERFPGAL
jgi:hypothetical protein